MIARILAFSVHQRWLVVLLSLVAAAFGIHSLNQLQIDAVPGLTITDRSSYHSYRRSASFTDCLEVLIDIFCRHIWVIRIEELAYFFLVCPPIPTH
jgi:hypothetical protein